jgi:hypothetical protein
MRPTTNQQQSPAAALTATTKPHTTPTAELAVRLRATALSPLIPVAKVPERRSVGRYTLGLWDTRPQGGFTLRSAPQTHTKPHQEADCRQRPGKGRAANSSNVGSPSEQRTRHTLPQDSRAAKV